MYPKDLSGLSPIGFAGSALLAGAGIMEKEFIYVKRDEDIEEALTSYLQNRQIHPGRKDLVILDIEPRYPDPQSPNVWKTFTPTSVLWQIPELSPA